uniref:SGNH hydrolase-type esterase domain-containing protein n=1 Tax=Clytia hemisphaerica TaxID=252671 RepID=A0A7M5UP09_9CNID
MADSQWEKELRRNLLDLLTASFRDNDSLSEELKKYAIKNHLLDDITNFIQNEHRLFDQKIRLCREKDLQTKINEIIERKNYFYIGSMKNITYNLWQIQPSAEKSKKWKAYTSKHLQEGEKLQTFYSHVTDNAEKRRRKMIEENKDSMFCLNDEELEENLSGEEKGVIFVLEYSKISYKILVAGDCLLNGIKSRKLHEIHKSEVVVYPRATTGELFKNYTKGILRSPPDVLILHFGTYDLTLGGEAKDTIQNIRNFIRRTKEKSPRITIALSSILVRVDRKGMRSAIKHLNSQLKTLCAEESVDFINNENVTEPMLCQKMLLTLNAEGKNTLAQNISTYINELL